jgi:hypothetical protein
MAVPGPHMDQANTNPLRTEMEADKKNTESKTTTASKPALFRNWERGTKELVETAFKQETVGLVTRDEYIEKKSTIEARLEVQAHPCAIINFTLALALINKSQGQCF